jgi:hypothetical protein
MSFYYVILPAMRPEPEPEASAMFLDLQNYKLNKPLPQK